METNTNSEQNKDYSYSTHGNSGGFDFSKLIARVKEVITNPTGVWKTIQSESDSITSIYKNYLIPLAAAAALASFLGQTVIGITLPFIGTWRMPFVSGLVSTVVMLAFTLAAYYIAAMIIEFLAPKFDATGSREEAFRLLAYASTPVHVLGLLAIIPVLGILAIIGGLYSLYLFFVGMPTMIKIAPEKRLVFFLVYVVVAFFVFLILGAIASLITPTAPTPAMPNLPNFPNLGN